MESLLLFSIILLVCLLDMLTILKRFLQSSFRPLLLGRILSLGQSVPPTTTGHEQCSVLEAFLCQLRNIGQCFGYVVGEETEPWEGLSAS